MPEDAQSEPRTRRGVPLLAFLHTETASSACLLLGIVAALVWFNAAPGSYDRFWGTGLDASFGAHHLAMSAREFVNSGLMTLFFLVVGLEARREFDLGDLRERRRFVLPMVAGLVGMVVPAAVYLAVLHGRSGHHGWGAAMSTDTALALGALSLLGKRVPAPVRLFLLSLFVVDDIVALVVIAVFYSDTVHWGYLAGAAATVVLYLVVRRAGVTRGPVFALVAVVAWVLMTHSGVDPVVLGLVLGLLAPAYTPARDVLEGAVDFVRGFREQPTAALARGAINRLAATQSPNDRLQTLYHPWSSYVIVPLFALANIGVSLSWHSLDRAFHNPVTVAIVLAYVVGKPVAVVGAVNVMRVVTRGRERPPVGWLAVLGSGTIAGVGFTVSLLVASRVFTGDQLQDAKVGALTAAVLSTAVTAAVYLSGGLLEPLARTRALLGDPQHLTDLVDPVDDQRDHVRGPEDAVVTLVEYGDFECPYCGRAEPIVRAVLAKHAKDVRYVWRHLPLTDVHPHAELASEAAEVAGVMGKFWEMHDLLIGPDADLTLTGLVAAARSLGLDEAVFTHKLREHKLANRVAQDVESADLSGVSGTPTFFVNGLRHYGAYDEEALTAAVEAARKRALLARVPTAGSLSPA